MNNIFSILKWDAMRNLNLLRKSVDKGKQMQQPSMLVKIPPIYNVISLTEKWSTEPAVVNAFYNPNKNDIGKCFYLALLHTTRIKLSYCSFSCRHLAAVVL